MTTVYAIGETVFDIIFDRGQPKAARAGGSMLNTAVSLGRCGLKVEMITELGNDRVGEMVLDFLHSNGVSTTYTTPVAGFKTPVSLAFLDEQGNGQFSFYKNYPDERLNIAWPMPSPGDVVLFGSFYSLDPAIHDLILSFIRKAKSAGAMVIYDPNIRANHLAEIGKLMHYVEENIALADIIRGSDEDFENLFGLKDGSQVFNRLAMLGCRYLVLTRNSQGADLYSDHIRLHVPAPKIKVVSTIGAGDSFNSGIMVGLNRKGFNRPDLAGISEQDWKEIIGTGIAFASEVCQSFDNYVSSNH